MKTCSHLDTIAYMGPEGEVAGCEECLATGGQWVHLRMCLECGHIGCCDDSPNRHSRAHWEQSGHVIIRSVQPGEDWCWCFADEVMFRLKPRSQPPS